MDPLLQAMAQSIEQAESKAMLTCNCVLALAHHVTWQTFPVGDAFEGRVRLFCPQNEKSFTPPQTRQRHQVTKLSGKKSTVHMFRCQAFLRWKHQKKHFKLWWIFQRTSRCPTKHPLGWLHSYFWLDSTQIQCFQVDDILEIQITDVHFHTYIYAHVFEWILPCRFTATSFQNLPLAVRKQICQRCNKFCSQLQQHNPRSWPKTLKNLYHLKATIVRFVQNMEKMCEKISYKTLFPS